MSRPRKATSQSPEVFHVSSRFGDRLLARTGPLANVEGPLLTLGQVVIVSTDPLSPGQERFTISGQELAALLSFRERYKSTRGAVDGADVNLRLRGLANLLAAHYGKEGCQLDEDGAYFMSCTLEDLAARLEVSGQMDGYRVGVLTAPTGTTAVA
jgi:hypothetical protein